MRVPGSTFWSGDMPKLRRAFRRRARGGKLATGLKMQYVPGSDRTRFDETPYFVNERKRRRRRSKLAKLARRRNRT